MTKRAPINKESAAGRRGTGRGEEANAARSIGKYESDREDERWNKRRGKLNDEAAARRDVDPNERQANISRASVGSFSDLVLEEYEKMNMDPLLGGGPAV